MEQFLTLKVPKKAVILSYYKRLGQDWNFLKNNFKIIG